MYIQIYENKIPNIKKTLENTINLKDIIQKLNNNELISKIDKYKYLNSLNLWDLGRRSTSKLLRGEYLAISCCESIYIGMIIDIINDEDGEIGDIVGWTKLYNRPWVNVILLKDVKKFSKNDSICNLFNSFNKYKNLIYKNFFKI
jgi:hypothetical protein